AKQVSSSSSDEQPCPALPRETPHGPKDGHWHAPVTTPPGKARRQCADDSGNPEEGTACRAASRHTQRTTEEGRLALLPVDPPCPRTIGIAQGGPADWQNQHLALLSRLIPTALST